MPFKRKIAEVEAQIEELRAKLASLRGQTQKGRERDRLLGTLARLNASRTRLMLRQLAHGRPPGNNG